MIGLDPLGLAVAPRRPTLRWAAPFVAVATIGLASAFLPPFGGRRGEPVLLAVLFVAVLGLVWASTRTDRRTWLDPAGPLAFFAVVAVARDVTGGSTSSLAPLVALPILWLALIGTRRDLVAAAVLTLATFIVPIVVVGEPDYPLDDWRRAALWTAFAALVAPVVQRVVRQLDAEMARERAATAEVETLLRGARLSSIISTDLDGRITSFSAGAEALLGHRQQDVVGRLDLVDLHDPAEIRLAAEELGSPDGFEVLAELARRNSTSRIWRYETAEHGELHVRLVMTEMVGPDDRTVGYLAVAIDVSESVRGDQALREAEARWRILLDHLPDLTVLMIDKALTINAVGGAGALRQGLTDAVGANLAEVSAADNVDALTPLISRALAGLPGSVELPSTRTGAEHEITVTPLPTEGETAQVLLLARDVGRDRARDREIVAAKERAEQLFTDAPQGVAVLAADGTFVQVNDALRLMLGSADTVRPGATIQGLGDPGDDRMARHLASVLNGSGEKFELEWKIPLAHTEDLMVTVSSRMLTDLDDASDAVIISHVVDVSERRRYERRLTYLADHDPLTGLVNRRRFNEELERHLDRCDRYGDTGAVLLLDLDNFKEVNDTLGHNAGDELIVSTAALLHNGLRSSDVVARIGGDEFAILLFHGDVQDAETVARMVVERVADHTRTLDGTRRRVTASVGVASMKAAREHGGDVLALADLTMYDAKDAGRNTYAVLEESVGGRQPRTGARLQWQARIERALENDDFALHLQPILDLETNRIESAEVLLRLADSDRLEMPSRFLYIAERTGLMPALDAWVVERAIGMLPRLQALRPGFGLEVNLSGHSIGSEATERAITDALRTHDVDPATLILEITETAAVADIESARAFAERMTSLGCKFALDDFGAGFGSFYYLKHLLFDFVKIDGEFVANCHRSEVDRSILRSVVGIAHDLGKRTVAEFVAEPGVLDVVRAENVDLAQGFHIGKPAELDDFIDQFLA